MNKAEIARELTRVGAPDSAVATANEDSQVLIEEKDQHIRQRLAELAVMYADTESLKALLDVKDDYIDFLESRLSKSHEQMRFDSQWSQQREDKLTLLEVQAHQLEARTKTLRRALAANRADAERMRQLRRSFQRIPFARIIRRAARTLAR